MSCQDEDSTSCLDEDSTSCLDEDSTSCLDKDTTQSVLSDCTPLYNELRELVISYVPYLHGNCNSPMGSEKECEYCLTWNTFDFEHVKSLMWRRIGGSRSQLEIPDNRYKHLLTFCFPKTSHYGDFSPPPIEKLKRRVKLGERMKIKSKNVHLTVPIDHDTWKKCMREYSFSTTEGETRLVPRRFPVGVRVMTGQNNQVYVDSVTVRCTW